MKSRRRSLKSTKSSKLLALNTAPFVPRWIAPLLVVSLTLLAFAPVVGNGFVNWDDNKNFLENRYYRGLGWDNLRWMFTTFHMGHYQPLSWVTLGLDYVVWGMNPAGYHLTNLLLHCANAVVFYFLAVRLFHFATGRQTEIDHGEIPLAAALSALLFAIHPLRVESVAWVTERRDVLCGLFFFLTVLFYLKAVTSEPLNVHRKRWLGASLAVYFLSLLSKASSMTLPIVLLVLDVYPLRRLGSREAGWFGAKSRDVWLEKIPYFVFAIAAGLTALIAQYEAKAIRPFEQHNLGARLIQAMYGLIFYLRKTFFPVDLSPLYELPRQADAWREFFLASGVAVLIITVALFVLRRRWPAALAVWIVYMVVVAPTLGIAQSGPQLVADRYSYFSCLGWALLGGWGFLYVRHISVKRKSGWIFAGCAAVAAIGVAVLGGLTWRQTLVWRNSETLWRHAVSVQKESSFAHNNLGNALAQQERLDEATVAFREVLRINPADPDVYYNLGNILARKGEFREAVERFHQALRLDPDHPEAHYDLGNALARQGELNEAVIHFRKALIRAPQDARAHYNAGYLLAKQRKLNEAVEHLRQAARIDPKHVKARYYLAIAEAELGNTKAAVRELREIVRIEPQLAEAHTELARLLAADGNKDEAVRHYQEALRLLKSQTKLDAESRSIGP